MEKEHPDLGKQKISDTFPNTFSVTRGSFIWVIYQFILGEKQTFIDCLFFLLSFSEIVSQKVDF